MGNIGRVVISGKNGKFNKKEMNEIIFHSKGMYYVLKLTMQYIKITKQN